MSNAIKSISRRLLGRNARFAIGNESGQGLIELALGVSLCVVLIIGATEFGRLAYASIEISNAAHAGAAYGSQTHTSASNNSGMMTAALNDGPDVTALTASASHSCVCANGTASTCSAGDCASSRILEYVEVDTTGTVDPMFHVPGLPRAYTLTGKAVMRVVQ